MTVIQNISLDPSGAPATGRWVTITLNGGPAFDANGNEIISTLKLIPDNNGMWSLNLAANSTLTPAGTSYTMTDHWGSVNFVVPVSSGTVQLKSCIVATIPASQVNLADPAGAALAAQTAAQNFATSAVATETTRAEAAEYLNSTATNNEVTRAEAAEGVLTTNLATETSRAKAAENANTGAITAETNRAEAAEALAAQKSNNLSDLQSASTARTNLGLGSAATHASTDFDAAGTAAAAQTAAQNFATSAVATETTRAEAAESTNANAISAETTRAQAAEATLIPLSQKGAASGVATLDSGGKVPISQLPSTLFEYQGTWNASTNSPALTNGVGTSGYVYRTSVAGSANFGAGAIAFQVGDLVIYDGSQWQRGSAADGVSTVAGRTGDVVLTVADVSGAVNKANNLSDLASIPTARTNLGLGNAAVANIDATATDIAMNGTQAAGSTGKVADAGHVHPTDTTRAADSAVVHNTGTETIGGAKTFTGSQTNVNGALRMGGSWQQAVATQTANISLTNTAAPMQSCNAAAGAFTLTLVSDGTVSALTLTIQKSDSSSNPVTVNVASAGTIGGLASIVLSQPGQTIVVTSTSTAGVWQLIDQYIAPTVLATNLITNPRSTSSSGPFSNNDGSKFTGTYSALAGTPSNCGYVYTSTVTSVGATGAYVGSAYLNAPNNNKTLVVAQGNWVYLAFWVYPTVAGRQGRIFGNTRDASNATVQSFSSGYSALTANAWNLVEYVFQVTGSTSINAIFNCETTVISGNSTVGEVAYYDAPMAVVGVQDRVDYFDGSTSSATLWQGAFNNSYSNLVQSRTNDTGYGRLRFDRSQLLASAQQLQAAANLAVPSAAASQLLTTPQQIQFAANTLLLSYNQSQTINQAQRNVVFGNLGMGQELSGTGSPQGVVTANVGARYIDTAATNGAVEWLKTSGTGNTGWKVSYGDTGVRNISSSLQSPAAVGADQYAVSVVRKGDLIDLVIDFSTTATWTSGNFILGSNGAGLFTGFKPIGGPRVYLGQSSYPSNWSNQSFFMSNADGIKLFSTLAAQGEQRVHFQWITNDDWPATLPGVSTP